MTFRTESIEVGTTAPTFPEIDDVWVDTSGSLPVLKVYDGQRWETIGGAEGVPGPPGGAMLTGYWRYHTATTAPPSAGQFRTDVEEGAVGETVTAFVHHTDADGYVWEVQSQPGDQLLFRDTLGNTKSGTILTVEETAAGPTGYNTITVQVESTSGSIPRSNQRVQINLVRIPSTANMMGFVNHGAVPDMARPNFGCVTWRGSVEPVNMLTDVDLWVSIP